MFTTAQVHKWTTEQLCYVRWRSSYCDREDKLPGNKSVTHFLLNEQQTDSDEEDAVDEKDNYNDDDDDDEGQWRCRW